MKEAANSFLVAVQFMTRFPVSRGVQYTPSALAKAAVFFPAVGLLVGLGGAALNLLLSPHVNRDVVVVLILVYLVTVTGGLHEDALGGCVADGFGGEDGKKDRILAIMRDSRIGSFGAIAITLGLLASFCVPNESCTDQVQWFLYCGASSWALDGTTPGLFSTLGSRQ